MADSVDVWDNGLSAKVDRLLDDLERDWFDSMRGRVSFVIGL